MKRQKEETSTSRVYRALREADDFRSGKQLQDYLGMDVNHVTASLHHLRKYSAVDAIEGEQTLWWYATPESDARSRTVEERVPEAKPRRPRRKRTIHRGGLDL